MASSQDTEITLGTAKLLGLFFGLVIVCAVFFALGYTLGRKSDIGISPAAPGPQQATANGAKPGVSTTAPVPMTFYKAVEQRDANAQLTPAASEVGPGGAASPAAADGHAGDGPATVTDSTKVQAAVPGAPVSASSGAGYFVQVAAVSKQEDAQSLVGALQAKQYAAFIAGSSAADKLFRVQIGPFSDIQEAEAVRSRLVNDGYTPILKK
jgi:cell division septation protein DedD